MARVIPTDIARVVDADDDQMAGLKSHVNAGQICQRSGNEPCADQQDGTKSELPNDRDAARTDAALAGSCVVAQAIADLLPESDGQWSQPGQEEHQEGNCRGEEEGRPVDGGVLESWEMQAGHSSQEPVREPGQKERCRAAQDNDHRSFSQDQAADSGIAGTECPADSDFQDSTLRADKQQSSDV